MLDDARELDDGATLQADLCIVGAGAAGITLAREMRGLGLDVLVLESGGTQVEPSIQALYEGAVAGYDYWGLDDCRVRKLGGTTHHWSGWCRPLEADDFEARSWIPRSGWPFGPETLRPYYRRAHETCQLGAYDYDAEALADRSGLPLLPLDPSRVRTKAYQFSPPTRFGAAYGGELEAAEDVRVLLHANVTRIGLTDSGDHVAQLDAATLQGNAFTVEASRYVLATGGMENPRLLLASNDVAPEGVGNASGLVGRTFMEHPHYIGQIKMLLRAPGEMGFYAKHETETRNRETGVTRPAEALGALALPREVREAEGLVTMAASVQEVTPEDIEDAAGTGELSPSEVGALLRGDGALRLFNLDVRAEQRPNPDSEIRLDPESTDALGMPRIVFDWRISEQDQRDVMRTLEHFGAELGRTGLGRVWAPRSPEGEPFPLRAGPGCHHMGTTRMSEDPAEGVVDANGRMHDVDNLWVAGSSVFPTVGFGNPTLTIVALAHRLADHLKDTA